ncbi:MAG: hypothetical protein JST82_02320 [Bacteroidetes bacterium]|nr:hypothetical protein [Bacteroidota bacterium]
MKRNQINIVLAAVLILAAAIMRVITAEFHLPNVTPVAAIGLFGGAVIADKKFSYLLPLLSLFIADLYFQLFTTVQGFYGVEQLLVYVGMALVTLFGSKMGQPNAMKVVGYSLIGSFIFFIVSNFGSYLHGWNGYGFSGLVKTYTLAIPFYKYSIAGDLIGSIVLFSAYALTKRPVAQVQNA